uniref:Adenosine kinase n=1 Tax=Philodina roseola TaxID=96448 RepID=B2ZFA0_PHIRO|nr:adenosine kinase [Philodina roseola]
MSTKLADGFLFGIGNPLLDIIAEVPVSFLDNYKLKANDAILASDEHKGLNEILLRDFPNHQFVAGGATQNTMRAATWFLQQPNVSVYMGCVGQDKYHQLLHDAASKAGLLLSYQIQHDTEDRIQTGTCAVLITGNNRSLVANLGAANHFTIDHLDDPKNRQLIENAKIFYTAGFFYTVCPPAVMKICEHADKTQKIFCTNLSAPFICEFFGDKLMAAMPFVDYLFGNETEARTFAKHQLKLDTEDVKTIAKHLAELPKKNCERQRVVVITQGSDPTVLAVGQQIKEFPVKKPVEIVDTNGAGDSFVGGFLAALALGKTQDEAVEAGAYCALECIQQSGCRFPDRPKFSF